VRAVVLRSATAQKVWSAGHDVDELPQANRDPLPYDDPLEGLLRAVVAFPVPVIAMVQGSAWGGACDLVMTCDMAFGDETCAFAITPAKLGLPYNAVGVLHFLNRLPLNMVMEMFCTAQPIPAERALRIGIINDLVPAAALEERVYKLSEVIATRSSEAISSFKATAHALAAAMPMSPETFERIQGLRRCAYLGADYNEGVRAFVEKRAPRF
jgi:methylmalonyl-CoA decarboxylase